MEKKQSLASRADSHTDSIRDNELLLDEQRRSQKAAFIGRSIALLLIACLVTALVPWPGPLYLYALLFGFLLLGLGAWRFQQSSWARPWHLYLFVAADFALLTFTLLYPNPLLPLDYPPQFIYRYGNSSYIFILLAGLTYQYRPRLVLWGGLAAAVTWALGLLIILNLPDTIWRYSNTFDTQAVLQMFALPNYVDVSIRVQEIGVILITTFLLTLSVVRSRAIATRQANLAKERANLARYFPTKTAELLAGKTNPFSKPRELNAGILFADLVSFTSWSQRHTPTETITMLRAVHSVLSQVVFKHNGTLDKFIGDGLMATFGTPDTSEHDAINALKAAIDMADEFDKWQGSQNNQNMQPLALSIGVHFGRVVVGDIGTSERLEFAVLGDAVNVASRLESSTRELGCRCLISQDLITAAKAQDSQATEACLKQLTRHEPIYLKGRSGTVNVYVKR